MANQDYGDPTPAATAYIGLIGVLIFVLTIIYLEALFYHSEKEQTAAKLADDFEFDLESPLDVQQAEQMQLMNSRQYFHDYNEQSGRVTIPVEEAIGKLLEEWPSQAAGARENPVENDQE